MSDISLMYQWGSYDACVTRTTPKVAGKVNVCSSDSDSGLPETRNQAIEHRAIKTWL